jgi:hypothetical protein
MNKRDIILTNVAKKEMRAPTCVDVKMVMNMKSPYLPEYQEIANKAPDSALGWEPDFIVVTDFRVPEWLRRIIEGGIE